MSSAFKNTLSLLEVTPESYKYFSCGSLELDEYLKRYAKGNHKKGLGKTFVLKEEGIVIGFYTISMGSLAFSSVPNDKRAGLPKYPTPIAKIGRLAVDERFKKSGGGKFLQIDALLRIHEASRLIAAFAIIVDAKDSNAKAFYKHFGFIECQDSDLTLFLPMETVQKLFVA
jgi:GNAT superfamily N-acetyltransferase